MGEEGNTGEETTARQQLEYQNERLESVVSVISHDLRNPLNVAQNSLELVEEESDHVDRLDRSLDRMEDIIEKAVTLARQGEPVENPAPVYVSTVAEDAWQRVETGGATLETAVDGHHRADADRLADLFENLFRNAVEHSSPGRQSWESEDGADGDEPAVTVRVGKLEGGFYVADDGPGIPPERRKQVFEPGYTTARHGTGLGLPIVRSIAQAHGWSVDIGESQDGGARVEITGVQ
ncbi:MAG: HAMP domain-containing sensor histidine kinase [Halovenus sp.]